MPRKNDGKAGKYLISFNASARAAISDTYILSVRYNNGSVILNNIDSHRQISTANRLGVVACSAIADLPANATVELWVANEDTAGRAIVLEHTTLSVVQIGG